MKAIIFAAGLGTRLKPLTNDRPKALVEVCGKTLLEHAIIKLSSEGFNDIIINVHHFSEKVIDFVNGLNIRGVTLSISDESDELLDTAGGIKKAESFFNDGKSFLAFNVDVLSNINLKELYDFHIASGSIATLAVRDRHTSRYFLFDDNNVLSGWENKSTGEQKIKRTTGHLSSYAFSGIHIIDPVIFKHIPNNQKVSITPTYLELAATSKISGYIHNDDIWMDVGKPETIGLAEDILKQVISQRS